MRLEALLVQFDDQLLLLDPVDGDVGDAVEAQQAGFHHLANDVEQPSLVPLPRQVGIEDRSIVALPAEQRDAIYIARQQGARLVHAVAYVHHRQVHFSSWFELDAHIR